MSPDMAGFEFDLKKQHKHLVCSMLHAYWLGWGENPLDQGAVPTEIRF